MDGSARQHPAGPRYAAGPRSSRHELRITAQRHANPMIMALALCAAVAVALAVPAIRGGLFDAMSTDDAMRLVEVRDLIAGQGWFDLIQYRLDPPGLAMHWSRVVDAPLAGLILLLRPLLGGHGAELATLVLWPTGLLAAALLLVAAISGRMVDGAHRHTVQLAAIMLAALAAPALIHFRAGAIDHHNAQLVLLLSFLWFLSGIERSLADAALAGLAAALSVAVGLEMLPAIAIACVATLGLLLWRGSEVSRQTALFGATLAGCSLLLAVLLLPHRAFSAPVCDAFGAPFLLLIAGGGASLVLVAVVDHWRSSWRARLAVAATTGAMLLASFFELFPQCISSPYAAIDPVVASVWLDHVAETVSLPAMLQLEPQKIPGFYGFPLLTLVLAAIATVRSSPGFHFRFILATATLAALVGTSFWEMRGAAAATLVAAPILPASLTRLGLLRIPGRKLLIAALVTSPASFAAAGLLARPLIDRLVAPAWTMAVQDATSSCRTVSSLVPLAQLPRGRIMAPIDLGPGILAATDHSVFAAPYHRNNDGNRAMLNVMLANPIAARPILARHRVDYVVICSRSLDQADLVRLAPDGLAARLGRGETPDFLQPVRLNPVSQLAAWRVLP